MREPVAGIGPLGGGGGAPGRGGTSRRCVPSASAIQASLPSIQALARVPATRAIPARGPHAAGGLDEHAVDAAEETNRTVKLSSATPTRADTRVSRALTSAKSPSQARTWSTTWEPEAPSQPPPAWESNHQPGVRACGSATRETNCTRVARCTSPRRPSAMGRPRTARSGVKRNSWPTRWATPARSAASRLAWASATSSANGFSQSTCLPARAAASVIGVWVAGAASRTATVVMLGLGASVASRSPSVGRRAARRVARVRVGVAADEADDVEPGGAAGRGRGPGRRTRCPRRPRRDRSRSGGRGRHVRRGG